MGKYEILRQNKGLEKYLKHDEYKPSEDFGVEYYIFEYLSYMGEFSESDEEYLEQLGYTNLDYFYDDECMQ